MRLIDANALNADFIQRYTANADVYLLIRKILNDAPAVDAVEVVRCRECKYYIANYCTRDIKGRTNMFYMRENDFCSFGERKVSE